MNIIIATNHAKNLKIYSPIRVMGSADNRVCLLKEDWKAYKEELIGADKLADIRREYLLEIKNFDCDRVILCTDDYSGYIQLLKDNNMVAYVPNQAKRVENRFFRGELSTGRGVVECVDRLNKEAGTKLFKTCLDIGVTSYLGQDFNTLADDFAGKADMVLIRECDGYTDRSMVPFSMGWGAMDWNRIMCGLRKIGSNPLYIIDYHDSLGAYPMSLQKHVEKFGTVLKEYFEWQIRQEEVLDKYDEIVLFGAGRMFRNYMRNYGENHKPLFTCDNNPALWGQNQLGIDIKNPEELKNIPQDCAIFLCNTFYDEMTEQINRMGIKNPVERFSDEYLPVLGE